MRRLASALLVAALAVVAAGCGSSPSASTTDSSTSTTATTKKPTKTPAPPICAPYSRFNYDLAIAVTVTKPGSDPKKVADGKAKVIPQLQKHADEFKKSVPTLAGAIDARLAYGKAVFDGTPPGDVKAADDKAKAEIKTWARQSGCV